MKKITLLFCLTAFAFNINAQVGIGTTNPQADLDVNGTLRLASHFEPAGNPGTVRQILVSDGSNNPPIWAATLSASINHFNLGLTNSVTISASGTTIITITDPNIVGLSSANIVWFNRNLVSGAGSDFSRITTPGVELTPAGQWELRIYNPTTSVFTTQLSWVLEYN